MLSLEMVSDAHFHFKRFSMHIIIIGVTRVPYIIRARKHSTHTLVEVELPYRIQHKQVGIALIALRIQIQRIDGFKLFLVVSFPSIDMIEACVHNETSQVVKLHKGFRLYREARTHIIVAVDNIIIIALRNRPRSLCIVQRRS